MEINAIPAPRSGIATRKIHAMLGSVTKAITAEKISIAGARITVRIIIINAC